MASKFARTILDELGLVSLWRSTVDIKLLCIQRFVRLFAYGGSTLILVAYLASLGISTTQIGLFMTLTLVGDVLVSLVLTLFADALGRRAILTLGAFLMTGSGVTFALSENYWILLLAAILGVISPSGNEIGPFRAIEESALAQLTPAANRGDIYAWYSLMGHAGTATGMIVSGWVINYLRKHLEWHYMTVYRSVFWGYAFLGLVKLALSLALSKAVEAEEKVIPEDQETTPLLTDTVGDPKPRKSLLRSLIPDISADSRVVIFNICVLFAIDSLASGIIPLSWQTFFFQTKFHLAEGTLGTIFFVTSCVAAISTLIAASIAKRIGNILTMVFTHLPSSIFLVLIPVPSSMPLATLFLILRSCTQSMDTAPRQAFVAAIVRPHERTAALGLMNVIKTTATSIGPSITGYLAARKLFWLAFVIAGSLKVTYDLGLLLAFWGFRNVGEREVEQRVSDEEAADEE